MKPTLTSLLLLGALATLTAQEPRHISGIYPHLAMFNDEGECGTGAVVPWADRLWVITYGPHLPFGSSDKLYEITPDLKQVVRPESIGGTPANRMIHTETQQLLIGPYVIDQERKVRIIPPALMPGRLTGNARHLTDPANKAYYATMEEGLYEVDLRSLEVTGLIRDGNKPKPDFSKETQPATVASELPGYHGKGLFSGHGRLVYANNGDRDKKVLTDPSTPSGALAEWTSPGQDWQLVRRNQFTEVTGPGGIMGNAHPEKDPIWSIGWDHRSLILMCLSASEPTDRADTPAWHAYRLPKSSHSYDGAHGWNTEWPRIRDIGEDDLLMTMHGTFWKFPRNFTPGSSAGISPRSNYLKVIGDFARWGDRLVLGCDDSANKEFLNVRKAKGNLAGPGKSQSNLWFVTPDTLDQLGPVIGRGAVWLEDEVKASTPSDPYLFAGYKHRSLQLVSHSDHEVSIIIQTDLKGDGKWLEKQTVNIAPHGSQWLEFLSTEPGVWIRLISTTEAQKISAVFHYRNDDTRPVTASSIFDGIAGPEDQSVTGGVLHARGAGFRTLRFLSSAPDQPPAIYDMGSAFDLSPKDDPAGLSWTSKNAAIPEGVLEYDSASILYTDEKGRWRLPRGHSASDQQSSLGAERVCREVCTERDLFNAGGTFFELPAENAGGFAKIRPVTTHNRRIKDYASYRGLLVISGLRTDAEGPHITRSTDGKTALWTGAVDDLWKFGKPRGFGGPWKDTSVTANVPSDPYLFTGYDQKHLTLTSDKPAKIRLEADITGTGLWVPYQEFEVAPAAPVHHTFPAAYGAYWLRFVSDTSAIVTAQLKYD
ncbi:hypothetical protein EI77_01855 [Prosthecobacter fusiformis]|uniref:Uncharacterized protein n=1 Tax=Prosthecobacter fusiformis TaxID=48464 RepID=A0A4R7S7B3_9BACT|nr:hypothetical protein [Prosthecobacter fusiformis]TDU73385.1 hypothetical protein EI77_01855 [Prosthecobacter fusiformis]